MQEGQAHPAEWLCQTARVTPAFRQRLDDASFENRLQKYTSGPGMTCKILYCRDIAFEDFPKILRAESIYEKNCQ